MISSTPESVSTDYDIADRFNFEPLRFKEMLAFIVVEKQEGFPIQFGGQKPLSLSVSLEKYINVD